MTKTMDLIEVAATSLAQLYPPSAVIASAWTSLNTKNRFERIEKSRMELSLEAP